MNAPSTKLTNGRDDRGRFSEGNRCGTGNPQARRVARLWSALLRTVTPRDLADVVRALLDRVKTGDVPTVRELLDRTVGKPAQAVQVVPAAPD